MHPTASECGPTSMSMDRHWHFSEPFQEWEFSATQLVLVSDAIKEADLRLTQIRQLWLMMYPLLKVN